MTENELLPRLSTIESCYTSTYDRYKDNVGLKALNMNCLCKSRKQGFERVSAFFVRKISSIHLGISTRFYESYI